jgi:hypothetical protein
MVHAYRLRFTLQKRTRLRFHITSDERYTLYLDGRSIGRGPERGDSQNWFCEYHDLTLKPGTHLLVARVWSLGKDSPLAQMTVKPGFLLVAKGKNAAQWSTGQAPWEVKRLEGYHFQNLGGRIPKYFAVGADLEIEGRQFAWGFEQGKGHGWKPAPAGEKTTGISPWGDNSSGRLLKTGTLPPMMDCPIPPGVVLHVDNALATGPILHSRHFSGEFKVWQSFIQGSGTVTVPAKSKRRVLIDLQNYVCAYPAIKVSGGIGSRITLRWAEALYLDPEGKEKGRRDEIEDRHFIGIGDRFLPDGGGNRLFETLWWRCGRYLQLEIETASKPVKLETLSLRETRYPLETEVHFQADDPRWEPFCDIAVRALQMCAHETYVDCPYYEQLMYAGDTRIMMLCQYVINRDATLQRKAVSMFDASRDVTGLTSSRYPSRSRQVIPGFSLWWLAAVHDLAMWRGEREFIRERMPGVRSVLDTWLSRQRKDGLVNNPDGWNFQDWVPEWDRGTPPGADDGPSASFNWHLVLALKLAAELELWAGEKELAARAMRRAHELAPSITAAFWNAGRQLFADDLKHRHFSEHAQCLAILGKALAPDHERKLARNLVQAKNLSRAGIYFSHYLFESTRQPELASAWFERLEPWLLLPEQGFKTTPEYWQTTSRSDCHAWGAHPLYHFATGILGIRPAGMGFTSVSITPMPGPLKEISGEVAHPEGIIRAEFSFQKKSLHGKIELPGNLRGSLVWNGHRKQLRPGSQEITIR